MNIKIAWPEKTKRAQDAVGTPWWWISTSFLDLNLFNSLEYLTHITVEADALQGSTWSMTIPCCNPWCTFNPDTETEIRFQNHVVLEQSSGLLIFFISMMMILPNWRSLGGRMLLLLNADVFRIIFGRNWRKMYTGLSIGFLLDLQFWHLKQEKDYLIQNCNFMKKIGISNFFL